MVDNMLDELKKLNEAENLFDNDLLERIQWNELKDAYAIRVCDYPAIVVKKVTLLRATIICSFII